MRASIEWLARISDDVGNHDGVDFLVLEYVEGKTLAEQLRKGPLPLEEAVRYGCRSRALSTAPTVTTSFILSVIVNWFEELRQKAPTR